MGSYIEAVCYVNYDVGVCNLGRFGIRFSGSPCTIWGSYIEAVWYLVALVQIFTVMGPNEQWEGSLTSVSVRYYSIRGDISSILYRNCLLCGRINVDMHCCSLPFIWWCN